MSTLLALYLAFPTEANAARVARYDRRRPVSFPDISLEQALLAEARAVAALQKVA